MVIATLSAVGLKVIRMNPKRVRDFARADGLLAKTDALDAHVLALFGARMQPQWHAWPEAERLQLAAWVARAQQLTVQRAIERTRLEQTEESELRKSLERVIVFFGKRNGAFRQADDGVDCGFGNVDGAGSVAAHGTWRGTQNCSSVVSSVAGTGSL